MIPFYHEWKQRNKRICFCATAHHSWDLHWTCTSFAFTCYVCTTCACHKEDFTGTVFTPGHWLCCSTTKHFFKHYCSFFFFFSFCTALFTDILKAQRAIHLFQHAVHLLVRNIHFMAHQYFTFKRHPLFIFLFCFSKHPPFCSTTGCS